MYCQIHVCTDNSPSMLPYHGQKTPEPYCLSHQGPIHAGALPDGVDVRALCKLFHTKVRKIFLYSSVDCHVKTGRPKPNHIRGQTRPTVHLCTCVPILLAIYLSVKRAYFTLSLNLNFFSVNCYYMFMLLVKYIF